MALLPEALHVLNTLVERRLADDKIDLDTNTPPGIFHATVELDIPTMGCVACINSIDAALRNSVAVSKMDSKKGGPRVLEAVSSLLPLGQKGGRATVRVSASNDEELTLLTNALVHAVTKVGFASCTVQSVRKKQKE
jgi:copper chaperone CopZ